MPAPAKGPAIRSPSIRFAPKARPSERARPLKIDKPVIMDTDDNSPGVPGSTQGWSKARRRAEIHRILDHLVHEFGLSKAEANQLLANRTGLGINTVQGWASSRQTDANGQTTEPTRAPPDWMVLDVLRYELGLAPVRDLAQEIMNLRSGPN